MSWGLRLSLLTADLLLNDIRKVIVNSLKNSFNAKQPHNHGFYLAAGIPDGIVTAEAIACVVIEVIHYSRALAFSDNFGKSFLSGRRYI